MRFTPLTQFGLAALVTALSFTGVGAPAQAAAGTATVTVHVLTPGATPAGSVQVTLYLDGSSKSIASTDDQGVVSFTNVTAGNYTVSVKLPDGSEQWAYGKRTMAEASVIPISAGAATTIEETLLATGRVAGRLTDSGGNPPRSNFVTLYPAEDNDSESMYSTTTNDDGTFQLIGVAIGQYKLQFTDFTTGQEQWAHVKTIRADADPITVAAGEATTVDETLIAGGELRVKATGARGKAVKSFCVSARGPAWADGCTTQGEVVLKDVAAGQYKALVQPTGTSLYLRNSTTASVTAQQSTSVSVPLTLGGAVKATVRNRATGKPVAGACISSLTLADGSLPELSEVCTDAQGRVQTPALSPDTYELFVDPPSNSGLGAQWVGKTAGTGDQQQAAKLKVTAGKVTTAPVVRLDKAATVTGTVTTAADGKPVVSGNVSYSAWGIHMGPERNAETDEKGHYTLGGLGPYRWPLLFDAGGVVPRQWSGNAGNRFKAGKVQLKAGATVSYNMAMKGPGTEIRGTIRLASGVSLLGASVMAMDAATGDEMGAGDANSDGTYSMRVISAGAVKLRYYVDTEDGTVWGWYGGTDQAHATSVPVPASGSTTLDITAP